MLEKQTYNSEVNRIETLRGFSSLFDLSWIIQYMKSPVHLMVHFVHNCCIIFPEEHNELLGFIGFTGIQKKKKKQPRNKGGKTTKL